MLILTFVDGALRNTFEPGLADGREWPQPATGGLLVALSTKPDAPEVALYDTLLALRAAYGHEGPLLVLDLLTRDGPQLANHTNVGLDLFSGGPSRVAHRFGLLYCEWLRRFCAYPRSQPDASLFRLQLEEALGVSWAPSWMALHDFPSFMEFLDGLGFPYMPQMRALLHVLLASPQVVRSMACASMGQTLTFPASLHKSGMLQLVLPPTSYTGSSGLLGSLVRSELLQAMQPDEAFA